MTKLELLDLFRETIDEHCILRQESVYPSCNHTCLFFEKGKCQKEKILKEIEGVGKNRE